MLLSRKCALAGLATAAIITGSLASAAPAFAGDYEMVYLSGATKYQQTIKGSGNTEGAAVNALNRALRELEGNCLIRQTAVKTDSANGDFQASAKAICAGQNEKFSSRTLDGDTLKEAIDSFVASSSMKGCVPISVEWGTDEDEDGIIGFGKEICPRS